MYRYRTFCGMRTGYRVRHRLQESCPSRAILRCRAVPCKAGGAVLPIDDMRWSFRIGRVFGITLYLHVTFLLLLALIGYSSFAEAGASGAIWTLSFVCSVFA